MPEMILPTNKVTYFFLIFSVIKVAKNIILMDLSKFSAPWAGLRPGESLCNYQITQEGNSYWYEQLRYPWNELRPGRNSVNY